jgi:PAS domain S-box-containing protein
LRPRPGVSGVPLLIAMLHRDVPVQADASPRPEDLGLGPFFWVMRDAITVTEVTGPALVLLNPAAEQMFGYSLEDGPTWMTLVHPRDLPRMVQAFAPLWAGQSSPILETTAPFEAAFVRKDGAERVLHAFADVLTDATTGRRYVVGICRDVTDQLAQREASGRLEGVTLAARHFAHQFNNRLAFALGSLDLLSDPPDGLVSQSELLQDITAELEAAAREVADLQQIIRVETKETPVGPALDLTRSSAPANQRVP